MSMGYQILLFFVILGAVSGMYQALGLWTVNPNTAGSYDVGLGKLNSTQDVNNNAVLSVFTPWFVLAKSIGMIFMYIFAAIVSLPTVFWALGFPVNGVTWLILQCLQAPFQFVMLMWLIELWTGRPMD